MKRLLIIHTGGTISMSQDQTNKVITNEENPISQHQNIISQYAEVDEINLLNIPSPHMTISNVVRLRDEIITYSKENIYDGFVITHGTDTLEETAFLIDLLSNRFTDSNDDFKKIYKILNIDNIPLNVLIKNLSDGQKQKLKFLSFLLEDNSLIVLDEVTNALDKKTVNEIYSFLNDFIMNNPSKTILNITHNLSDLSNLPGKYFNFKNKKIEEYEAKEKLIDDYINL
ncbi:MAG: hypothetical protein DI572_12600 [Staphylococcus epidermidis]|nr:MAG: hypothetical protein DI572_12600 [Staphylococcus epidermidis]